MVVHSDLPARLGDSGGPLVNENGQLIGIHVGQLTGWLRHTSALQSIPATPWLHGYRRRSTAITA